MGALLGLYTIEKFGRKFNMMLFSLLIVAGWVILATAEKSMMALIGRTITGVALGISTFSCPVRSGMFFLKLYGKSLTNERKD